MKKIDEKKMVSRFVHFRFCFTNTNHIEYGRKLPRLFKKMYRAGCKLFSFEMKERK